MQSSQGFAVETEANQVRKESLSEIRTGTHPK